MTTIDVPPSYPTFEAIYAKPVTSTSIPSNNNVPVTSTVSCRGLRSSSISFNQSISLRS